MWGGREGSVLVEIFDWELTGILFIVRDFSWFFFPLFFQITIPIPIMRQRTMRLMTIATIAVIPNDGAA